MRILLFFLSFLIVQISFAQVPEKKVPVSPFLSLYLENPETFDRSQLVATSINGETHVSFLAKIKSEQATEELEGIGAKIGTKAGNIWTLLVPIDQIVYLTRLKYIEYLEMDRPIGMFMDKARMHANIDSANAGYQLPLPLSGKNVVVGIIDAGFEYMHPSFYDTSGVRSRVKLIWEQKKQGTPPSGFAYGNEIRDTSAMRDSIIDTPFSHGTHVGGIAAGSGIGSDSNELRGIAFESDLVFVGIRPEKSEWTSTGMGSIIDGTKYIYDYAKSVGKPAVVNLSWGGSVGPNDGSSLFAQALASLTGPGKLFVTSAGNNGGDQLHLFKSFSPTDSLIHSFHDFGITVDGTNRTWIDIWGEPNEAFCVQVALWRGSDSSNHTDWYCLDDKNHQLQLVDRFGDTCLINLSARKSDYNGRPHMLLDVYSKASDIFSIKISSQKGDVHVWSYIVHEYVGYSGRFKTFPRWGNMEGDDKYVMGAVSCANHAITVGAFSAKPVFTNYRDQSVSLESIGKEGEITSFSSKGPTTNHRVKPNIAAPGMLIASGIDKHDDNYSPQGSRASFLAKNIQFNGEEFWYAYSMGTSMSSPVVAGIVALMLEVKPELYPAQAQSIIDKTAILDSFTTQNPDSSIWGRGKINGYAAIKYAIEKASIENVDSDNQDVVIYPNPNSGRFIILTEGMEKGTSISVFGLAGNKVFETKLDRAQMYTTIQLQNELKQGVYLVKINSGDKHFVKRVVLHQGF